MSGNIDTESCFAEKWIDTHCKQFNSFANDLPEQAIKNVNSTVYALLLSSIIPWNSNSIKRTLEKMHHIGERRIKYSISMSFFHIPTKKFYGSTFVGHEHFFVLKNLDQMNNFSMKNLNELVYFHTSVVNPNSVVVCELIVSVFEPMGNDIETRHGCGFAIISPFLDCNDEIGSRGGLLKSDSICVYEGSPRDLLGITGQVSILKQLSERKTKSIISYKSWRCDDIGEVIRTVNIIKENEFVGATTRISGLLDATVEYFDSRGSVKLPCIGAETSGNILDWSLTPATSMTLAPLHTLKVENLVLTIPQRSDLEQACCQYVSHACPRNQDGVFSKMSRILRSCSSHIKGNRSITIISRRLRIGTHNGQRFMNWEVADLNEDETSTVLRSSKPIEVVGFDSDDVTIVFFLEYICEEMDEECVMKSPAKLSQGDIPITIGSIALSPFNKMLQRIGSCYNVNFMNDARCSGLTSNIVFSPSNMPICNMAFDIDQNNSKYEMEQPRPTKSRYPKFESNEQRSSHHDENNEDFTSYNSLDNSTLTSEAALVKENGSNATISAFQPKKVTMETNNKRSELNASYSILNEVDDPNNTTEVIISMISFRKSETAVELAQSSLAFLLKFCENDEIMTEPFSLKATKFSSQSKIKFEYSYTSSDVANRLATYLLERSLFIEIFDDCKLYVGTIDLPMHSLVRQGKSKRSLENISVDVVSSSNICHENALCVKEGALSPGIVVGTITFSIELNGRHVPQLNEQPQHPSELMRCAQNMLDTNTTLQKLASMVKDIEVSPTKIFGDYTELKQKQQTVMQEYVKKNEKEEVNAESLLSFVREVTPQGPHYKAAMLLNAAEIIRENMKNDVIAVHIANKNKQKSILVKPLLGQSLLIEVEFKNSFAIEQCFEVQSSMPGLRMLSSTSEWKSRRKASGAIISSGKQSLVQFDCMQNNQVKMRAHQTLVLPLVLDQRTTEAEKVTVSLVTARSKDFVHHFELDISPQIQYERRFIIPCRYNEHVNRKFSFRPKKIRHAKDLSIKVIDQTTFGVKYEWRKSLRDSETEIVYDFKMDAKCSDTPLIESVYVIISSDDFVRILECWKITFETKRPLYDHVCMRAISRKEIIIKGCQYNRIVNCRAMILPNSLDTVGDKSFCRFEKSTFQLLANQVNKLHINFQFQAVGRWDVLLNCADKETGELLDSFILSVQCYIPALSKEYFIEACPGREKQIKLPFTNTLDKTRIIDISSSNDFILTPQTPQIQLGNGETVYARFRVKIEENIMIETDSSTEIDVYLFTRDVSTNTEDCVRLQIKIVHS